MAKNNDVRELNNRELEEIFNNEIKFGRSLDLSIPLNSRTKQALEFRANNLHRCKNLINKFVPAQFGNVNFNYLTDFGVNRRFKIRNIPCKTDLKITTQLPFCYTDKTRNKMIKAHKIKLFETERFVYDKPFKHSKQKTSFKFEKLISYYMGVVDNEIVLYRESIDQPINTNNLPSYLNHLKHAGSYHMDMFVAGKRIGLNMLFRYDHNNKSSHMDFFSTKPDFYQNVNSPIKIENHGVSVIGSHIHFNNFATNIILPSKARSSQATELYTPNISLENMCNILRNNLNTHEDIVVFNKSMNSLDPNKEIVEEFVKMYNKQNFLEPDQQFFISTIINKLSELRQQKNNSLKKKVLKDNKIDNNSQNAINTEQKKVEIIQVEDKNQKQKKNSGSKQINPNKKMSKNEIKQYSEQELTQ